MLFEVLEAGPVAELGEGYVLFGIVFLEQSLEGGVRVLNPNAPCFQMLLTVDEFLFAESAVLVPLLVGGI